MYSILATLSYGYKYWHHPPPHKKNISVDFYKLVSCIAYLAWNLQMTNENLI